MPVVQERNDKLIPLYRIMTDHGDPVHESPSTHKWRVTPAQKQILLAAFEEEPYPDPTRKLALATELGVTGTQISKWFQHRRESLSRIGKFKAQYNRSRRTLNELRILEDAFEQDSYPSAEKLAQLETELANVTAKQIKLWFKHRRKQVRNKRSLDANSKRPAPEGSNPSMQHEQAAVQSSPRIPSALSLAAEHQPVLEQQHKMPLQTNSYLAAIHPPFSHLELMALRGALCMSRQLPSIEGMQSLSTFLGRPVEQLQAWFQEEIQGGFFWSYMAQIVPYACVSQAASGHQMAPGVPVEMHMRYVGRNATAAVHSHQPPSSFGGASLAQAVPNCKIGSGNNSQSSALYTSVADGQSTANAFDSNRSDCRSSVDLKPLGPDKRVPVFPDNERKEMQTSPMQTAGPSGNVALGGTKAIHSPGNTGGWHSEGFCGTGKPIILSPPSAVHLSSQPQQLPPSNAQTGQVYLPFKPIWYCSARRDEEHKAHTTPISESFRLTGSMHK